MNGTSFGQDEDLPGAGPSAAWRQLIPLVIALLGIAALVMAGTLLPVQRPLDEPRAPSLVGRLTTLCTLRTQPPEEGASPPLPTPPPTALPTVEPTADPTVEPTGEPTVETTAGPAEDTTAEDGGTTISAVTVRQAAERPGSLTGHFLTRPPGDEDPPVLVTQPGFGQQVNDPTESLVLEADGALAGAGSAALLTSVDSGERAGLLGAPCRPPATSHWFAGLGAGETYRSEIVLSNPDTTQAEVDLRFFGVTGRLVVPGAPGLVIPAHGSRTVALAPLLATESPLTVWVRASEGRVAAMAFDVAAADLEPGGADWHPASVAPATDLVIPGVPAGEGTRELVVTNPGAARAAVAVSVLAPQGPYTPTGAESVSVAAESTTTVPLTSGLDGQTAAVRVRSDQPVTAAVRITAARADLGGAVVRPDLAVLPAAPPMGRTGVSAIATTEIADSELIVSNGSDEDVPVTFDVYSLQGVSLRHEEVFLAASATSTRRLRTAAPSYVVVQVPAEADVYGTVALTRSDAAVAGVTSLPVLSPAFPGRIPSVVADPRVAR